MSSIVAKKTAFPALYDPCYPVFKIAAQLEPYLRVIVEKFSPKKIILFGSQAYGEPNEHSDVDLLILRDGIISENQSNLEIRQSFWSVTGERPSFTLLTKTPGRVEEEMSAGSHFYEEILTKGLVLYAEKTVE